MSLSIENFEQKYELSTLEQKEQLLSEAYETFDKSDEINELLEKYKYDIKYLKEELAKEIDIQCNGFIDNGLVDLYRCISPIDDYIVGNSYYIKIDDVALAYRNSPLAETESVANYIKNIKPVFWIISDNGIGTLKFKKVLTIESDLNELFELA